MGRQRYSATERADARKARMEDAHKRLEAGVLELMEDDGWRKYLDMTAKLHSYSFSNTLLILSQHEDASMVAGFRKWQEMGRSVRKGERAIWILAPFTGKRDPGEDSDQEPIRFTYFRPVPVFDVAQTDGEPVPKPPTPVLLEGNGPELRDAYARVQRELEAQGITTERVSPDVLNGANGDTDGKRVRVRDDVSDAQALKTLVHEYAHNALGHAADFAEYRQHRGRMEVEADSVAYLVLADLGIDASSYSFAYVAGWAKGNAKLVQETAETVSACARLLSGRLTEEG